MAEAKKYGIVYADPPWRYDMKRGKGVAENHYPTMSMDEICALPVADLAAKDSALFLWATFPQLNEAFRVIEAWGFHYGPAPTRRYVCWQHAGTRNASVRESTSL